MKVIKTADGYEYKLSINISAVRRIRNMVGYNLPDLFYNQEQRVKLGDDLVLAEILWATLAPQAAAKEVSEEQFFEALRGDSFADAKQKLLEELPNFSVEPERREMLEMICKAAKEVFQPKTLISGEQSSTTKES